MRRTLLTPLIAALVLAASLMPASALAMVGSAADRSAELAGSVPVTAARPIPAPVIRLGCALIRHDDPFTAAPDIAPAVACRWSAVYPASVKVRAYQLWRVADPPTGARRLIATIPAAAPLRFVDTHVRRGHVYVYAVVALARNGSKVAVSNRVVVKVPPVPEVLRMACALGSTGDQRGVICKWSAARHPAAFAYVLWRSVDGGPREAIYKSGLDGKRWFVDSKVKPGQKIRYAVIVVNKAGGRVGQGGPVVVRIPSVAAPPIDAVAPGAAALAVRQP